MVVTMLHVLLDVIGQGLGGISATQLRGTLVQVVGDAESTEWCDEDVANIYCAGMATGVAI